MTNPIKLSSARPPKMPPPITPADAVFPFVSSWLKYTPQCGQLSPAVKLLGTSWLQLLQALLEEKSDPDGYEGVGIEGDE